MCHDVLVKDVARHDAHGVGFIFQSMSDHDAHGVGLIILHFNPTLESTLVHTETPFEPTTTKSKQCRNLNKYEIENMLS